MAVKIKMKKGSLSFVFRHPIQLDRNFLNQHESGPVAQELSNGNGGQPIPNKLELGILNPS